jgi:5-methylthioadenosine/S-adenosylhomocysteine deaminase
MIDRGWVVAIERDVVPIEGAQVFDIGQGLVMPGLVNAHFHSSVNHMKGRLPGLPLELFMLYESPSLDILRPTPREAYVRTLLACMEMLKTGVTSLQDDAFFMPGPTPEIIDAVMQAYADSGMRVRMALDQSNLPDLGKLPYINDFASPATLSALSEPPVFRTEHLLEAYHHLIDRWNGAENGRLMAAISCSAPQRVSRDYANALAQLSEKYDLPFYIHILETRLQRHLGVEKLGGRSLVTLADELGILNDRANVIHAIWVDSADLDLIAERGAAVAHNPISNLRLGSGVMPFREIRDRGITIALGSDEAIADDAVNMWEVAKMAGLIHNIGQPDYERWPTADEILKCLFDGGHKAMRTSTQCGRIAVGFKADLTVLDLDALPFTPLNDLSRQLVYCENGSSVRMTMVDGKILYRDGTLLTVDEAQLRDEARSFASKQKAGLEQAAKLAAERLPAYREMYLKSAQTAVGMNRWVGA